MAITIEMPRLSDSMHEGIVLRWVKKIGDFVEVGDHLADIETDKAHVELQACEDGTLMEILVAVPPRWALPLRCFSRNSAPPPATALRARPSNAARWPPGWPRKPG